MLIPSCRSDITRNDSARIQKKTELAKERM